MHPPPASNATTKHSCYVNLAVFKANTDRPHVSELVGAECEQLIFRFCSIDRHHLIYAALLDAVSRGKESG